MSITAAIDRNNVENILDLSPLQKGILYHYLGKPNSKAYVAQLTLYLNGSVNISLLHKACRIVTRNNEMLRTVFRWVGLLNPVQIVLKDYEIPFYAYDFSKESETDPEIQMKRLKEKTWARGINICRHPIEIIICKIRDYKFEMFICWHHIVYDGWSNAIFIRELLYTYDNLMKGIIPEYETKIQYKEFIKWCRQGDEQQQEKYWKTYFKDFAAKTPLPVDGEKKAGISMKSGCYCFTLPENLLLNISSFTTEKGTTLAILMYCAWAILLNKYTAVRDIVFGATVSGRSADIEGIENVIGLFINTLPLRVTIDEKTKIRDILEEINQCKKSWVPYESTDLAKIKACSGVDAKESLFDSIVVVENYPLKLGKWLSGDGTELVVESFDIHEKTEFSLVLGVLLPHDNTLTLQYNTEQFTEGFVEKMAEYFLHIVNNIITGFDRPVSEIELLLEKEKEKMLLEVKELQSAIDFNFDF